MARPTKYKKEHIEEANSYIEQSDIPFMGELALKLNVDRNTITNWCDEHDEFFSTIKRLKTKQRFALQQQGLHGDVNTTMAIFLLKCNHQMVETEKLDITSQKVDMEQERKSLNELYEKIDEEMDEEDDKVDAIQVEYVETREQKELLQEIEELRQELTQMKKEKNG